MNQIKTAKLHRLADKRRRTNLQSYFGPKAEGLYRHIGEFHNGAYECAHVSPWTKSAANVSARWMVVGQDWSSTDHLELAPLNQHVADWGFDPDFPTNTTLDALLSRHLATKRHECYFTNLFPFIKIGAAGKTIPMPHLTRCAQDFLVPQIEIVMPRVVICLGLRTHCALMRAIGNKPFRRLGEAIDAEPHEYRGSLICAAAHTGSWGARNRGTERIERDWARIAALMDG